MPLVFDDEVQAPPASSGRLVFDDEQAPQPSGRLVFDDEQPVSASPSLPVSQSPLETGARAAAQAPGQTVMNAYSGLGRAAQTAADTLRQKLPGPMGTVAGNMAELYSYIPRHLGPLAKDIANESERVYAPDRAMNPKAATVGAAVGQALPMAASAIVAGPSGPLALGAGQGMDQGLDQAEEMGITSPARKLALGAAYAGIEAGVERLGGFGSKAFTAPAKRTLMEMAKAGGKTVLSEGVEEPITGVLQDASAVALAPPSYDSTELRPFVMSPMGVPVPNQSYFDRRGLETLGGLAGGAVGAGVQTLANRSTPAQAEPPAPTSDPLAAFAATMPTRSEDIPVRSPVTAPSIESGMFDAPAMEGDILRDYNVQPAAPTAGRLVFDDETATAPTTEGDLLADYRTAQGRAVAPQQPSSAQAALGGASALPTSASVTPEASPVTIPETPASAPVTSETDAGSTPAAGISSPAVAGGIDPGGPGPMDRATTPAFGSAAPVGTTRRVPVIPDAPYGGADVLDYLNDNTIAVPREILDVINQKKGAQLPASRKGDFNWLEKYEMPKAWRKYFFTENEGDQTSNINEVAQRAHEDGLIPDPTPDALMGAVLDQIAARESYTRDVDAREKQLAAEEKALIAREKAEAKRQQSWADDVINGSMETPFIGIDPKLMAAYTVKGAQLIKEGFTTFAKWSREMISRFGEKVKDYLQGVWQAAMKTSEQGFVGGDPIRNTHAAVDERRAAEGRSEIPHGGQGTTEQWQAEAAQRLADDPRAGYTLTAKLIANPRQLDKIEEALMRAHVGQLQQRSANASAGLDNPATDPAQREESAALYRDAQAELDQTEIAVSLAGSAWGAAGRARQMGLKRGEVPSLSKMVADITLIQDPTGRTPLPPEERAVIEKTHAKMVEAEQALEKQREEGKGGAQETFNTELQRLLDEAREEIKQQQAEIEKQKGVVEEALKPRPRAITLAKNVRAKIKTAADEARERMKARGFQFSANPVFDPQFIADAAIIMADNIADGINGTIVLVREFGDAIKPFLNQIRDKAEILIRDSKKKTTPADVLAKGRKAAAANEGKLPRSLARQLALAHIVDHIERKDKTLSAAKIADLVRADLEEFQPGITTREARDLISGYGQATFPNKDEARTELRNLAAQMQKITQLEALRNKERLLKSGPQRDKPSAELRELQKQVEELKKEIGYEARSKEDELKSARDRIKTHLENQIEELQRVLAGKARPANPREAVVYDAELNALKDLRGSLRDLVAEMPEHKLASEARRNKAAMKSAQKSEAEWNRRAKAMQWTRPGKPPAAVSAEVDAARAKAKEARENFEALKKAAVSSYRPDDLILRDFKRRTQKSIDDINTKIRTGAYDPPKKTPRQIKHDQESEKLKHDLAMKKREWIDLKLKHRMDTMGWGGKGLELVRKLYHLARSLKAGGEFSGVLNQGMIPMVTHPLLTFGSIPKMFKAFVSPQNETAIMDQIWARGNSINGRYKKHRLAINDHMDYSTMQAEGNYRSAWGNKIPFFAGTGRAYTTLLNHMRADLFDHLVSKLEARKARRNEPVTDREMDMIAEEVNNSTGHGKLPFGLEHRDGAKDLLGAFVFSPSFVMARARYLAGTSLWHGSKDSRAIIATERIRAMAGFAALYALALAMQGDDDEEMNLTEPRDSTWMKPKLSRTYLDLLAGLQQIAVLASRLATGTSITNGKKTDLTDPNGRMDRFDLLLKFGKSKRSPALTMADEFINRKDYNGKPITRAEAAWNSITPITAGSIRDLIENEPPELAVPLSAGAFFGLRTDTRAPRQ